MNKTISQAMRWAQLTFCEGDMDKFDPDYWLNYFEESSCDGVVLGSGGYMAFHPTEIPLHYCVSHPRVTDLFGYMVEQSRRKGYSVICRTDGHAFHNDAFDAHPEWVHMDADYVPKRHWSYENAWVSCVLNDYGFKFMNDVHKEIAANYDIDGIFCNRWAGSGVCYCPQCRKEFMEYSGSDIPTEIDYNDPLCRVYSKWREEKLFKLCDTWDLSIKKQLPKAIFIPNSTVGPYGELDSEKLAEYSDILFCDRQSRSKIMPPWFNGRNGKEMRAVMEDKPIGGIFSVGIEEAARWKDSVQHSTELKLWVADAVANGLRPWFTKFSAQVFDARWMDVVKKLYNKYSEWEKYLIDTKSLSEVALMFSQHTVREYARNEADALVEEPICGYYQALVESKIPFDMFDSHNIVFKKLINYSTIIMPNIAVLSDNDIKEIKKYVEQGGNIIATYETSLYDEKGNKRNNFGLSELFGVDYQGEVINDIKNSYIKVEQSFRSLQPILIRGLEDGVRMIGSVNRVKVNIHKDSERINPFKAVPAYPDLPMEEVYPRSEKADYEEVAISRYGKGNAVYIAGDLDRQYWRSLAIDHKKLLANIVEYTLNGEAAIYVDCGGFVDVTIWENKEGVIVHLVNMTTIHAMRGPADEVMPLFDIKIKVRNDLLKKDSLCAIALENKFNIDIIKGDKYSTIDIPILKEHEVIII
jgi:hypothetical protein